MDSPSISHLDPHYKWRVLGVVMIGTFMAALDTSIVNVSLPNIMADFGVNLDDIDWVITSYMLTFAAIMPLTSWLKNVMGSKWLYVVSLFIFTVGSLFCGMATNLTALIIARVLQAIGGAGVTPTGMAIISDVFEPEERGRALGYWGVGVIIGPAIGPTLGGILTRYFGWRYIFTVNLPVGLIGVLLGIIIMKKDIKKIIKIPPFDFAGFVFFSTFLISLLLGISKGESEGWGSPYILRCWIFSILGCIGFILVQFHKPVDGLIDIRLLKNKTLFSCLVITGLRSIALFGGVFLLPIFLQEQMGLDEIQSGIILFPGALMIGLLMPISGKLSDRDGPRKLTIVGLIGVSLFMFMYRNIHPNFTLFAIILPTLVRGVGLGLLLTPVTLAAMNAIHRDKSAMTSSLINMVQQVSGSFGISVLSSFILHRTHYHLNIMGSGVDPGSATTMQVVKKLYAHAHMLGYNHADAMKVAQSFFSEHVIKTAQVASFQDAFLLSALIVMVGIPFTFGLPNKKFSRHNTESIAIE